MKIHEVPNIYDGMSTYHHLTVDHHGKLALRSELCSQWIDEPIVGICIPILDLLEDLIQHHKRPSGEVDRQLLIALERLKNDLTEKLRNLDAAM